MTEFDAASGFKAYGHDAKINDMLDQHFEEFGLGPADVLKNWTTLVRRQNIKRFLLQSDLFRQTLDLPGDIAELGVYRGAGLLTWANLLEAFAIGDRTKTVYGFDNWAGFTGFQPEDGQEKPGAGKVVGGFNPANFRRELESAIKIFDADRFVPWKPRIKLIDGAVETTLPAFLEQEPGIRFSLVHFDMDVYEPTRVALDVLWDRVVPGGVLIFDEYGIPDWPGETRAVDAFLARHPGLRLETVSWTNSPAAWLVKP